MPISAALAAAAAAAAAFPAWSALGPNARRALLNAAADALERRADESVATMGEIGATEGWARFNLMLAAGMVREAAAMTTQIGGEVIPSDKPGCIAHGAARAGRRDARHRAVERADHPWRARHRRAAGLRQHAWCSRPPNTARAPTA